MNKLIRIKYNNKIFDVFSDDDHNKQFLEVVNESGEEKYNYPILEDYIMLHLIYNNRDPFTFYRKIKFKTRLEKELYKSLIYLNLSLLSVTLATESVSLYQHGKEKYLVKKIENYKRLDEKDPLIVGDRYHIRYEDIILEDVTFDELRKTASENANFTGKYRKYLDDYIDALERKLPDVDLRIFNDNLKNMKLDVTEKLQNNIHGLYNSKVNITALNADDFSQDNEFLEKEIVFHELTHSLHLAVLDEDQVSVKNKNKHKNFEYNKSFSPFNSYGISIEEGMTELIAIYLMDNNSDTWDAFCRRDHYFVSYPELTPICYDLMRVSNKFNLYDFLNGDIYMFEEVLKDSNQENAIDVLDAEYITYYRPDKIQLVNPNKAIVDAFHLKKELQREIEGDVYDSETEVKSK